MAAIAGAIFGFMAEILKTIFLVRQFRYCIRYKTYRERLAEKADELISTKMDVELKIKNAKKNLETIKIRVENWVVMVNAEVRWYRATRALMNADEFGKCSCRIRYRIGKKAFQKIKYFDELIKGGNFESVSHPFISLDLIELVPTIDQNILDFPSRVFTKNQVMEALKDKDTFLVGIYGMGGVGKTTLMKQVWKQVIEEKVFDAVVMITISKGNDPVRKIQADIANQLGLTRLQQVSEKSERAALLSERFRQGKNILVILEDLWKSFLNLSADVGIPCDSCICKVAITATGVDICRKFGANNSLTSRAKYIEVGVLSPNDSITLFQKNVGRVPDEQLAREVVEICTGLPLALVTLGRAMINKPLPVWIDTVSNLKRSNYTMLGGGFFKVFASIEQSYRHLENNILKKCFLFCSLFHKNCPIDIDQLVMYVMSDEMIFKDLKTLDEVRGRMQTLLDKLITSCLLLSYTKKNNGTVSSVTMHGIVRDVAIKIAQEESNGFFISKYSSDSKRIANCSRVALMENHVGMLLKFPDALPGLLVLSLQQNPQLRDIPDEFFRSKDALVSLNISKTGIRSLPISLSFLVNLQSLCLDYCDFRGPTNLSLVGNLVKLEMLSLVECCLLDLPNEIGNLSNLKSLDLSRNYRLIIPSNVISRLYCLEELYTMNSFKEWEADDKISGRYATLVEVASRTSLKTLHLMKENENRDLVFCISMGWQASGKYYLQSYDGIADQFECSLKEASPQFGLSIKMLLARVGSLMLCGCNGLQTVGELATEDGFNTMRALLVVKCPYMEFLVSFSVEKIPKSTFVALEKLYLHSLSNLKGIAHGQIPAEFFNKLKLMELKECQELVCIFPPDTLVKFKSLKVLRVENCGKLTEGFLLGKVGSDDPAVTFPELIDIYLKKLPKLMTIWKGVGSVENLGKLKIMEVESCNLLKYLFTSTMVIALQQLERLVISDCRSMVSIVVALEEDQDVLLPPQIFSNLRELIIKQCHSLTKLFPGGRLSKLQLLEVNDCGELEEILQVNQDERKNFDEEKYVFPQLEQLYLYELPSLKTICKGTIRNGSFKKLRKFGMSNCGNLKKLCFPASLVLNGSLSFLEYISVVGCKSLEAIIYDDNENVQEKPPPQEILPEVTELIFRGLPNLEMVVKGARMSSKSFKNLEKVKVEDCNIMTHLFPMNLLGPGGLPKLKHFQLGDCSKMESIFYDDNHGVKKAKSTAEEKQQQHRLSELIKVQPGQTLPQWPCLETIVVKNCDNLNELEWKSQQSKTLSQSLLKQSFEVGTSSGTKDQ